MNPPTIQADTLWNHTGIILETGVTYRFEVHGTWYDASIDCGGEGYEMRERIPWYLWPAFWAAQCLKPLPTGERWFQLVGKVEGQVFEIGGGATLTSPGSGELLCAANDARGFYCNNRGSLSLVVTRELKPQMVGEQ